MGKRRPKRDLNTNGNRNPALFAKERFTFFYLNTNLNLKIYFSAKHKYYVTIGAMSSFNIKNKSIKHTYWSDGSVRRAKWKVPYPLIPQLGWGINIGLGYVVSTSSKMNFYLQPIFSYMFTPIENDFIKENLYAIGLRLGIGIKLK